MLDRTIMPDFQIIEKINLIKPDFLLLTNKLPVYSINAGEQEVSKIEFVFEAGHVTHPNPLMSSTVNSLLKEGTSKYKSSEISEKLDFYGAFLEQSSSSHHASITLFTLNKYIEPTLEIVCNLIFDPIFPQKELETYIKKQKQKFIISKEKVEKLASDKFFESIFGENHPYGIIVKESDFEEITVEELKKHYNKHYLPAPKRIIISGKISEIHIEILNKYFSSQTYDSRSEKMKMTDLEVASSEPKNVFIDKKTAVQSSIRMGKITITKLHPDYAKLKIVNTILGGYFGSRLMTNIREDKGYTYGISSNSGALLHAGYFIIAAETGTEVCKDAVVEIKKELKKLRTELVEEEELSRVKNFMLGELLRDFDGPFALSEIFRSLSDFDLTYDFFDNYINEIKTITPEIIKNIAQKYLHEDSMTLVVAGQN